MSLERLSRKDLLCMDRIVRKVISSAKLSLRPFRDDRDELYVGEALELAAAHPDGIFDLMYEWRLPLASATECQMRKLSDQQLRRIATAVREDYLHYWSFRNIPEHCTGPMVQVTLQDMDEVHAVAKCGLAWRIWNMLVDDMHARGKWRPWERRAGLHRQRRVARSVRSH